MKLSLIPNWRKAWRMLSVQIAALLVVWLALPIDTQAAVLSYVGVSKDSMTGIMGILIIVGRVVAQPRLGG
jgi:hypothetical protein